MPEIRGAPAAESLRSDGPHKLVEVGSVAAPLQAGESAEADSLCDRDKRKEPGRGSASRWDGALDPPERIQWMSPHLDRVERDELRDCVRRADGRPKADRCTTIHVGRTAVGH